MGTPFSGKLLWSNIVIFPLLLSGDRYKYRYGYGLDMDMDMDIDIDIDIDG